MTLRSLLSLPFASALLLLPCGAAVTQQAFVKAENAGGSKRFGTAIAMHGDTVVIGEPGGGPLSGGTGFTSGAIHVYVRTAGVWSHQATLTVADLGTSSNRGLAHDFGASVAIHGDTIVVGAPGEDSSTTGVNSVPEVVLPYPGLDSGAAYVFRRGPTGIWSQEAYIKASNTNENDKFGRTVSISGDTVVVGAPQEDGDGQFQESNQVESSGAAYVFTRTLGVWSQQAYLKAGNPGQLDYFGTSVAVSGDTIIVGAPSEDSTTSGINSTPNDTSSNYDSGAAYVFERSGSAWTQQAYVKPANAGQGDQFGIAVALSGETAVVGAHKEDSSVSGVDSTPSDPSATFDSGAAYVFYRFGSNWSQQGYLKASNPGNLDWFGESVAISGNTVVVGARSEDSETAGIDSTPSDPPSPPATQLYHDSGAAYVFTRTSLQWSPQSYIKAGNAGRTDAFGTAVAVSGDSAAAGAPYEDSSTTGINPAFNNSAADAGAAYLFTGVSPQSAPQVQLANAIAAAGLSGPQAAAGAMPFGDGVPNLIKYAFNMNLSGPDSHSQVPGGPAGGLPAIALTSAPNGDPVLRIEFVRRIGSGLIYTPQISCDPANPAAWTAVTDTPAETPIDAAWERVIYEEPVDPALAPACFGRVQVMVP